MRRTLSISLAWVTVLIFIHAVAHAQQNPAEAALGRPLPGVNIPASCMATDRFFEEEVWAKVGERTCLKCHHAEGEARKTNFILSKPDGDPDWCKKTRSAFANVAAEVEGEQSKLLVKVTGDLITVEAKF